MFLRNELGTVPLLMALCGLSLLIALVICLSMMSEKVHLGGRVSVSSIRLEEIGVSWGKECFEEEISFVFITYRLFFSLFCYCIFDLECWNVRLCCIYRSGCYKF